MMAVRKPLCLVNNRITVLPPGDTISGATGSNSLLVTKTDLENGTYYYYGGMNSAGWKINRYLVGNVAVKVYADEVSNGLYSTLDDAWTNRATLVWT